jgi:hypothetical protein
MNYMDYLILNYYNMNNYYMLGLEDEMKIIMEVKINHLEQFVEPFGLRI